MSQGIAVAIDLSPELSSDIGLKAVWLPVTIATLAIAADFCWEPANYIHSSKVLQEHLALFPETKILNSKDRHEMISESIVHFIGAPRNGETHHNIDMGLCS